MHYTLPMCQKSLLGITEITDEELLIVFSETGYLLKSRLLMYQTGNPVVNAQSIPDYMGGWNICT